MRSQKLLLIAETPNSRHENPVLLTFARTARHALSVISILFTVAVLPAAAQTWTGNTSGLWTNPGNWSPAGTPVSSTSTQLIFEKTSHAVMTNDIPGTMSLNSMTFNLGSNAYSLSGNALKVGSITTNSTQSVTISNAIGVASAGLVVGGSGNIALNGPISGSPFNSSSLTYNGSGTLTLGSGSNTYTGLTTINSGTVALAVGNAIPANTEVDIGAGGVFNIGSLSNTAATAISGLVTTQTGTFRATSGSGDYYINDLVMRGGTIDLSGTSNFRLHIIRTNTTIRVGPSMPYGSANWLGSGTSSVLNDSAAPTTIDTDSGGQLNAGIILSAAGANPNFIKIGGGGLRLSNTGNTADITVKEGNLQTSDLSTNVGAGAFGTLGTGAIILTNTGANLSILCYDGPTATTAKQLTLTTAGAIRVAAGGSNLTMTGSIGELAPGSGLTIFGAGDATSPGILTMSVNNSYSGPTTVRGESFRSTVLAVDSIGNAGAGGVNSPLGASSNAAANLKLYDGGELRLTGTNANYSTDRGLTLGITNPPYLGGVINVQNAGTTLTWNGQITNESGAGLTKSGAGTLVLANAFNNFGPTTIEAGRLVLGNGNSLSGVVNVQGGGTFAPTIGPGTATVGSLHLDRGAAPSGGPTLAIELGGVTPGTEYDRLTITGQFSLGGTLAVSLLNGFAPADGQSFDIFNWGSLVGTFDSLDLPTLSTGLSWDASNLYTLGILAVHAGTGGNGDYDHNGIVNAGDYIVWRNSGGALGDYATWRANFGNPVGSGAGSAASAAIPEPAAFVLLLVAALARCCGRRRAPF